LQKWIEAQKHEKIFWHNINKSGLKIPKESVDRFSKVLALLDKFKINYRNKTLLDIGSGPKGGILAWISSRQFKVALDPLLRTSLKEIMFNVNPLVGIAESLPLCDNSFNIVFCINVLDHAMDPEKVLREMFRVSRGTCVLMVHVVPLKRKIIHMLVHSTQSIKLLIYHLVRAPRPLAYIIWRIFKVLDIMFNEDILEIFGNGYAHPHYLSLSEVINIMTRVGFSIKTLKIVPDISGYGTFKMCLYVITEKSAQGTVEQ